MRTIQMTGVAATVACLAAIVVPTSSAAATPPARATAAQPFAEQAETANLTQAQVTALQSDVDTYLKKLGGKQVALNQIDLNGEGTVLVALPGETHPRDFTSERGRAAAADRCRTAPW